MRVAREWKVPHSTLIRDWTVKDVRLAAAYLQHLDDIGPCGHPHTETTRPENADRYDVKDDIVCAACRTHAEYVKNHESVPPGTLLRLVDMRDPAHDEEVTAFGPVFD